MVRIHPIYDITAHYRRAVAEHHAGQQQGVAGVELLLGDVGHGRLHVDGHEVVVCGLVGLEIDVAGLLERAPEGIVVTLPFAYEQLLARQTMRLSDVGRTGECLIASVADGEVVVQSAMQVL